MSPPTPLRVRFAIVGIGSALTLAFMISPGNAQPGRPGGIIGRPPGGIAGMPGGGIAGRPPGGITGIHGAGISGIHGTGITGVSGIHGTGISGISGIHGTGITGISGIHGAGISGIHGNGITGISGIGGSGISGIGDRYSWTCGKCKGSLGTTMTPFNSIAVCPHCGVRFNGTTIDHGIGSRPPIGGGLGIPPAASAPSPVAPPDTSGVMTVGAGALPTNPAYNPAPPSNTPGEPPTTSASPPATSDYGVNPPETTAGSRGKTLRLIGFVVGVILLVGFLAALGVVVSNAATTKPIRRRLRRFDDDD